MPPYLLLSNPASTESWLPLLHARLVFRVVLPLSLLVTILWSVIVLVLRRTRRMSRPGTSPEGSYVDQKEDSAIRRRKDSSHDEDLHLSTSGKRRINAYQERGSSAQQGGISTPRRPSMDQEPNQYLRSLEAETLEPSRLPIYPWIAPPKPLPGPYDAPYFPLPLPSIKRLLDNRASQPTEGPSIKTEETPDVVPEELETLSYTRRVSTNSIPDHESLLEGSVTVSTKGWRRTQWTVTAG